MERLDFDVIKRYPAVDKQKIDELWFDALKRLNRKIVVIDDDPTGAQSVHDVYTYTNWDKQSFVDGFIDDISMFYILTNSRSFSREKTLRVHQEVGTALAEAAKQTGKDYVLINRGDSTLRGHYPQETETLRSAIESNSQKRFDGEILVPFFIEGGRFTMDNVQYVKEGEFLTPCGQTEFAKDKSFHYISSHLGEYVEEKTEGRFTKDSCTYISLEDLRAENIAEITEQLMAVKDFNKVIVNALDYTDVKTFAIAFVESMLRGKEFLFRSATSLTKVMGGISDIPLLSGDQLRSRESKNGGIALIGSHVNRTTQQFETLKNSGRPLVFIEFNQHLVLVEKGLETEVQRVVREVETNIGTGKDVIVYTRRDRLDLDTNDRDKQLHISVEISNALTSIIGHLSVRPKFILTKGGNTSSDVAIKALSIRKALVLGQVKPGVPVWLTGPESKFPQMPFIIFPGNVGDANTLLEIIEMIS